ncbi:MAG: asparagine synthase (glutamine-hydrolyzing) [Bacteroidetes bacterium]|nr:asparagine synthase (glutamine-hydrolyzing) [Bacteroidota bacterium]
MCGIAGYIDPNANKAIIKTMTDALAHRGPDSDGSYFDDNSFLALGHRRLSILDLSTSANQPFYSEDGRYIIVFNGEVYNYKILANKFALDTKTTSDTEVILKAYIKKGVQVFNEFNGMFAIAIWDTQEKYLLLARDRMGIKPLYYRQQNDSFYFASEVKALTAVLPTEIDRDQIASYLYLGYSPGKYSMVKDVFKFPAGHYGFYKDGQLKTEAFWSLTSKVNETCSEYKNIQNAKKRLNELLINSVEKRMISDVPLGTFLSGGIDSSTVTAIAQSIKQERVKTFSIGFKESKFNEAEYARQVAQHLGTEHYEFMLTEDDAIEQIHNILSVYDEPFADSSTLPTMLVSEMARKEVTVALSGDGGDELFLGYGMYNWARRLNNPFIKTFRSPIASMLNKGNNRFKRAALVVNYQNHSRIKSHIYSQEQYYFSEHEIKELLQPGISTTIEIEENYQLNREFNVAEMQAFFDLNNYLKDDLLVKVDKASMLHSLEVRVPILDHNVVEFALNLDPKFKTKGKENKILLKEVLYDYVPKKYFARPKWGFGVPLIQWLQTKLRYLIDDYLNDDIILNSNLVDLNTVKQLKSRFFAGEDYLYNRIWLLILLHKWYKSLAIKNT